MKLRSKNTTTTINKGEKEEGFPLIINENYAIRTIVFCNVGKFIRKEGNYIVMKQCSWIADAGKWSEMLRTNDNSISQPFIPEHEVYINENQIVDITRFVPPLPVYNNKDD